MLRLHAVSGCSGPSPRLVDRQGALVERSRSREVALGPKQAGEVVEALRRIGVVGAERPLADPQGALVERSRRCEVALGPKQAGEVVEARCRMGWSGPSARSRIARARSKSGRACA